MIPAPIAATASHALDDDAWHDLLDHIEDRAVIPIVGPELLKVETETGPRLLYDWLARSWLRSWPWAPRCCPVVTR